MLTADALFVLIVVVVALVAASVVVLPIAPFAEVVLDAPLVAGAGVAVVVVVTGEA